MHEIRFDSARMGKNVRRDARGNVIVPSAVTRVGVFTYKRGDGSEVRELRSPEEVFAPASLASLEDAPVTDGHPPVFVTPSNAREFEVGIAKGVRRDGGFVLADLSFRRADIIAKVDRGEAVELSCGYTCDTVQRSGTYQGERYDQVQTNVIYNHVAIGGTGWGRAGRDVRLRMDGAVMVIDSSNAAYMQGKNMGRQRFDEFMAEVHDDFEAELNTIEQRFDAVSSGVQSSSAVNVQPASREDDDDDFETQICAAEARFDAISAGEPVSEFGLPQGLAKHIVRRR